MGRHALANPGQHDLTPDDVPGPLAGERAPTASQEQNSRTPSVATRYQFGACRVQVGSHRDQRCPPDRDDPLLRAFSQNTDEPLLEVEVPNAKPDQL